MKINKWELVRDFVNNNKKFTKSEMRKTLNIASSSNYTEGQYVNHMMNAGFVERTGRGAYSRIIKIPKNVTSTLIVKLSYDKILRGSLMKKLTRKQKLENIKNNDIQKM